METKEQNQTVEVEFGSHPPIESDSDGVATLLKQSILHYCDCSELAKYLIELKDVTQVIALEGDEDDEPGDDGPGNDEPDNDIYGVSSVIELTTRKDDNGPQLDARKQLTKFFKDKSSDFKRIVEDSDVKLKIGYVVNERYINLPPQLALPTLENLTKYLETENFTHLVFLSKILLRSRNPDTKLPSKRVKSGQTSALDSKAEPIIFVNAEEEIISENSECYTDIDVSSLCDENATWSMSGDAKYIPHRRIMIVDYKKWLTILKNLDKELK